MPLDVVANFINTRKVSNTSKQVLLDSYVTDLLEKIIVDISSFGKVEVLEMLTSASTISLDEIYQQLERAISLEQRHSYTETLFLWQVSYLDAVCAKCLNLYDTELKRELSVYYTDIKAKLGPSSN